MSVLVNERVQQALIQLRLRSTAERLDSLLSEAARKELSFLDFLDHLTRYELESKQRKRTSMGIQIAHFPTTKTLADFDYSFQPSVDKKLMTELATGRFIANGENVVLFGPPGVGKTHLAIGLGRAVIEAGYSALFISTTALIGALSKAESEGKLDDKLAFFTKPKLLIVDELGYLPFERRSAHLLFQLVSRRYEKGSLLITTNQSVSQWGQVFGDEVVAAAILDRLLHHSHVMVMQGQSYRLRQKKKAGVLVSEEVKTSKKLEKFHRH